MLNLKGDNVILRALEPEDLEFLYELENNPDIWEISGTLVPYSRNVLRKYLENAHRDIYDVKQVRFCICNLQNNPIGLIDLYDFDPRHKRAGIGLIISGTENRNKGAGTEALSLIVQYAFEVLELHQVFAHITEENKASIRLFEKMGFQQSGLRKDWIKSGNTYKSEFIYQKINS